MATHRQLYQLNREPFSKDIPSSNAFPSTDFVECTKRLDYLARIRGLALFTAAPGFGKSFALRAFAEKQNQNITRVIYVHMTTLTTMEFYRQLSMLLGLQAGARKTDMFHAIREHIEYLNDAKHIHPMIIIDEAQYLNAEVFRDLKMLLNFDYDSTDRLSMVLAGQPMLADLLSRQVHEALRQRIVINYAFGGITLAEAKEYAERMLTAAGGSPQLFDESALGAAYNGSGGSIMVFGQILSNALMIGAANEALSIDAEMVMAAANEIAIR